MKIALIGGACSGKTTVLETIEAKLDTDQNIDYIERIKFADQIYSALPGEKNREFMQEYGDLAKKYYGDLVFCDIFRDSVEKSEELWGGLGCHLAILCDDVRRPVEAKVAKELGFTLVYIHCPDVIRKERSEALGLKWSPDHNSEDQIVETAKLADYVIVNSSSIDHLKAITLEIVDKI